MMKADCRRLWRLADVPDFPKLRANYVAAFQGQPELLDVFRAAARRLVWHNTSSNSLLVLMQTTILMIEIELDESLA